uniref:Uncharacterized protein n=1 Tax=Avena sativa TaxID=4498 RepID=A0ACD5WCX9_AVESA
MSLFRRYVNLVTGNGLQGIYSLRRLNSDNFFYPANEAAAKARDLTGLDRAPQHDLSSRIAQKKKEKKKKKKQAAALSSGQPQLQRLERTIRPPRPIFTVRPTKCPETSGDQPRLHFFALSGTKIFFSDGGRRTALYDAEARCVITAPCLHARKDWPVALSLPSPAGPEAEGEQEGDSSLYIMDTTLDPTNATPFEALVFRNRPDEHFSAQKTWHCDALPRPPFFHRRRPDQYTSVSSYAVVGDVICVSLASLGTYCFDTVSRTWSLAGDWQMPFSGKAEYDPELELWFGVSADDQQLPCAADLSPVPGGHAPEKRQCYIWGDPKLPVDWLPDVYGSAQMVSLGSGRFCIMNYFQDMEGRSSSMDKLSDDADGDPIVVFSGLEVFPGNGNGKENSSGKQSNSDSDKEICSGKGNGPRMIKHKSRLFRESDTHCIESVL